MLALLHGLPRTSLYRVAKADDDEAAAEYLRIFGDNDGGKPTRDLRDFSPEVELLSIVVELLQAANGGIKALGGAKPGQIVSMPRPSTAVDRVRADEAARRMSDLLAEVEEAQKRWEEVRSG